MPADRLRVLQERWSVVADGEPMRTPTSRLLFGRRFGEPVVLKLALTGEERRGGRLMTWWAGRGAAEVLRSEADAVLLRRATGGRDLAEWARAGRDREATAVLAAAVARLHGNGPPPPEVGPLPLRDWFRALLARTHPDPLLARCARIAERIVAPLPTADQVALHGDVHHGNVLDTGAGWVAVDPKALVGHRGFDYANVLVNPDGATALEHLDDRLDLLGRLSGLGRPVLEDWTAAWCGLSLAWGDPRRPSQHDRAARAIAERLLSAG